MRKVQLTFRGQDFEYEKKEMEWSLYIKRSDVAVQDLSYLRLLNLHHPLFLEQKLAVDENQVQFTYTLESDGLTLSMIKARPLSERLRLALNVLNLEQCLQLPVTFFLHPENLFITKDEHVKVAYRGLPDKMVPSKMDEEEFLTEVKCYIISIFTEYSFTNLYEGALGVVELPEFLATIRHSSSIGELRENLEVAYREVCQEEAETLTIVKKRNYQILKHVSIWLSAFLTLLVIPLIYLIFIQNPFKEKLLDADTAFIKVDYSGVITELKSVKLSALPYTQKFELAYSYVKSLDFPADKEEVILNNVSLKTEELYLDYWIEIGRGHANEAKDIAKRLNDPDLILYAITQEMKQVREDEQLSGSDRESQLEDLQSDYDNYWEERTTALAEASEATATSSTDTASSTDTKVSESSNQEEEKKE